MLFMSFAGAIAGLLLEYLMYTVDWWQPLTVTGTRVGFEDAFLGFTNGGLGAILYEVIFKKRERSLRKDSIIKQFVEKRRWLLWTPVVALVAGPFSFWILGWHSFWATNFACLIAVGLMILLRQDLLREAVFGGLAMMLVSIPVFQFAFFFFPEVVEKFWMIHNLTGILVLGIPVEDLVFYFVAGATTAPLYEFLFEKKLVKLP